MKLFKLEFKRQLFSFVYLIFCIFLIMSLNNNFFGITQDEIDKANGDNKTTEFIELNRPLLKNPDINDKFFGTKFVENPVKIMTGAVDHLLSEYKRNVYATYPYGYYKAISLSKENQVKILTILCEITGLTENELLNLPDGYFPTVNGTIIHFPKNDNAVNEGDITIQNNEKSDKKAKFISQISYDKFKERMREVEEILGNGSSYSMDSLIRYYGIEEMTFDEAKNEFTTMLKTDKITGSFARLYCDIVSSVVGILPAFLAMFLWFKDLSANGNELIYTRKISSIKLVFIRFITGVILVLIPIIVLSFESLIKLIGFANKNNYTIDYFAYVKYIFIWILPTIMIVMSLSTFLTILTDSPIAVFIQLIWWFIDRGMTALSGDTKIFTLMIRHNTLFEQDVIIKQFNTIIINRLMYVLLSIILVIIASFILNKKRSGKFDFYRYYQKIVYFVKSKYKVSHC